MGQSRAPVVMVTIGLLFMVHEGIDLAGKVKN